MLLLYRTCTSFFAPGISKIICHIQRKSSQTISILKTEFFSLIFLPPVLRDWTVLPISSGSIKTTGTTRKSTFGIFFDRLYLIHIRETKPFMFKSLSYRRHKPFQTFSVIWSGQGQIFHNGISRYSPRELSCSAHVIF